MMLIVCYCDVYFLFFFSSRRRHTRYWRDWSSDVCSSDLGSLYRRSSFLVDSLGKPVFAPHVDVLEDPHQKRGKGSAPFDEEGVRTAPRKVVDGGRVEGYFLSSYSARKLGMKTTGNAGGSHNLSLVSRHTQPGDDLVEMLRKLGTGLFVIELMGQGVNYVTGDYSRGASGFWVENGEIAYPEIGRAHV